MISHKAVGAITLVILAVAGSRIVAAEQSAAELYGQGVHAYFASDYDTAVAWLTESIKKNAADPRPYYFRGLALAAQHGPDAALADFAQASELEVYGSDDRLYDVNRALQRVQGSLRLKLEKQRAATRLAVAAKKKKEDQVKYEEMKRREDIVLYQPDRPLKKLDLDLPEIDLGDQDPFATGAALTGGKEVAVVRPEPVEPGDDIATQTAPPEEQPREPFATPSPFGDMTPAPKKPKAEAESDAENPFGDDMGAVPADDPLFDENVRPKLPPGMNVGGTILDLLGKTLSGEAAESADRDPFSDESEPAVPPKKEPAPEASTTNPFDDAPPAEKEPPTDDSSEESPGTEPAANRNPFG